VKHDTKEDGRTFANIASVMKRPKAVPERLSPDNATIAFSLADRPFRQHEFETLPQWVRDAVMRSPEYEAATKPQKQVSVSTKQRLKGILADKPAPKPKPDDDDLDDEIPDFP